MSVQQQHRNALTGVDPTTVRAAIRSGEWTKQTAGLAPGYTQANLVVLPRELAYDFLLFCVRNPKPCPIIDVTDAGSPVPAQAAPAADLRTDLPLYRVYEHGELVEEPADIRHRWRDDMVAFLLGCSFTFEHALVAGGIPLRHLECGDGVPMYVTNRECVPASGFSGPLVVSMRPIRAEQVERATEISARYARAHGAPVHAGDPAALGIADLATPAWGDPTEIRPGEVPVFWACGVTPQAVALQSKPPLIITHSPGHMFVTDVPI
ncbi:MAG: putative hydro-lyase, partial [Thermomicrobiales bacterium]